MTTLYLAQTYDEYDYPSIVGVFITKKIAEYAVFSTLTGQKPHNYQTVVNFLDDKPEMFTIDEITVNKIY